MNNRIALISLATVLASAAFASPSANFNFETYNKKKKTFAATNGLLNNTKSKSVFHDGAFAVTVSGWVTEKGKKGYPTFGTGTISPVLDSSNILLSNESNELGLGVGHNSDREIRNGKGDADILELSNFVAPKGYKVKDIEIDVTSVDKGTKEGFYIYGSKSPSNSDHPTLDLLFHGTSAGGFDQLVDMGSNSTKYNSFWLTADSGSLSSVRLGNGCKVTTQAVPEPCTILSLAGGAIAFFRRRKQSN